MVTFREQAGRCDALSFSNSLEDQNLASVVAGWLQPRYEADDLRPEIEGDRLLDHSLDSIRLRKIDKRKAEIKERMAQCPPGEEEYNVLARELLAIGRRLHK
jgi:hypothetical protein